jgi:hypothetical protein
MLLLACSSVRVSQDFDPAMNIEGLKTYAWKFETQEPTGDFRVDNPLLDGRIREAVDRNMAALGFQKLSDGTPDFLIVYQYVIQRKIASDRVQTGVGFGFGTWGSAGGIGVSTGSSVSEFDEGLMAIDFLEATSGTLLWRGSGSRRVNQHDDPAKTTQKINEMVDKIMAQLISKG